MKEILLIEGADLTEALGVIKFEKPISADLAGVSRGSFPSQYVPRTDEERIQSTPKTLNNYRGSDFYQSEKLDGTSSTYIYTGDDLLVCSKNLNLKESEFNKYWQICRGLELERIFKDFNKRIAIQGEIIGPGIQANKYKLTKHQLHIYNIFDIDSYKPFNLDAMIKFVDIYNLFLVPITDECFTLDHTVDELVELSKGNSVINPQVKREGHVYRLLDTINGKISFKVINPDFLLKYDE